MEGYFVLWQLVTALWSVHHFSLVLGRNSWGLELIATFLYFLVSWTWQSILWIRVSERPCWSQLHSHFLFYCATFISAKFYWNVRYFSARVNEHCCFDSKNPAVVTSTPDTFTANVSSTTVYTGLCFVFFYLSVFLSCSAAIFQFSHRDNKFPLFDTVLRNVPSLDNANSCFLSCVFHGHLSFALLFEWYLFPSGSSHFSCDYYVCRARWSIFCYSALCCALDALVHNLYIRALSCFARCVDRDARKK